MRKMTLKSRTVIVVYSFILTAVFVSGIYFFWDYSVSSANADSSDTGGVAYLLTDEEWLENYTNDSIVKQSDKSISLSNINSYYTARSFKNLPFAVLFFVAFLMMSLAILWHILRRIQENESNKITRTLSVLGGSDDSEHITDPVIKESIEAVRQKFSSHLDDYKRLSSYLSHEQKNDLAILKANLEMGDDKDAIKIIDRISGNMDDVLTLSDNVNPSTLSPVDVALVCASVCDSYKKLHKNILFDFDEDKNTFILARERWIYRAASNLLDNAIKYGKGKAIEVTVRNRNHSVILAVRDHGIGIAKDQQERIFQNRYRVNELNRDGYGIGLSLISHVCDLCAGFVFVESLENHGSCFYLSFPEYG